MEDQVKKTTTPRKPRATTARVAAPKTLLAKTVASTKKTIREKGPERTATHDEIAALAHRFWAERGHQHGHDTEDWFRAEHELIGKAS